MKRIDRVAYRSSAITPDLAEAMRELEMAAAKLQPPVVVEYAGPSRDHNWMGPNPTECPPHLSMQRAGREVLLGLKLKGENLPLEQRKQVEIDLLWSIALSLGFMPWNRYPLPGPTSMVFHFLGPWRGLYDHLCGEGRGELAWPSMTCAAQVDVGTWGGDKPIERFVQAQLHRLGAHCGPVDGIIGERTLAAIKYLGLGGPLTDIAAQLKDREAQPEPEKGERRHGYVVVPGYKLVANAYGAIQTTRTPQGFALTVDGPGRVIIDVGGS